MSSSLLYHAFGVRGYQYVRASYVRGEVHFHITQPREKLRCSHCGGKQVVCRGEVEHSFLSVPIGGKITRIIFPVPRVFCRECAALRQVEIAFAQPRRSYTNAFERYVLQLCRFMTIRDVAEHTGASWDVIKDIQKRRLERKYGRPNLKRLRKLKWIGIDEISVRKGFHFLTLVLDRQTGEVVFIGKTRKSRALDPFWKMLQQAGAQIEAVAMDMSLAYYLKEDLRQLWRQPDKQTAMQFLDDWSRRAMASGVRILQTLAQTLLLKRQGILNWYDHPITTGPLEGLNNKIKTMIRQAYGFRDPEFLKLKIFAIHESKYALVG